MSAVAVLIPVLGRPHRVRPLLDSLSASGVDARVVFICSPDDPEQIAAVLAAGLAPMIVPWESGHADYAKKLNRAYRLAPEDWSFLGADDLVFHHGWFDRALEASELNGGACVVGTNDLGNARVMSGRHSTHSLVHRDYLECGTIDQDGVILNEAYGHQFVDDEFVSTARLRGTFAFARMAVVEHLHPDWGKGELDATYEKGQSSFWQDHGLYESRKHLWLAQRGTW